MKYRAVVVGVVRDGHPIQGFSQYHENILEWARVNGDAENADVEVYIREERHVATVHPGGVVDPPQLVLFRHA